MTSNTVCSGPASTLRSVYAYMYVFVRIQYTNYTCTLYAYQPMSMTMAMRSMACLAKLPTLMPMSMS